jgi:hypothetical protein
MAVIKRIMSPEAERDLWEKRIVKAAAIYGKVRRRYTDGKFFADAFTKQQYIQKQPSNKYHRILRTIIVKLIEMRGEHTNPWEDMFEDYIEAVHSHYKSKHKIVPFTAQLVPTEFTMHVYGHWIAKFEEEYEQCYWQVSILNKKAVEKAAADSIKAAQAAKAKLIEQARSGRLGEDLVGIDPIDIGVRPA